MLQMILGYLNVCHYGEIMRFCLVGKGIDYSLSPIIHNYHFSNLGIKAKYELLNITNIKRELFKEYSGFNITTPYKEEIIKYCDVLSKEAKKINVVNCVKVHKNKLYGFNTDIYGFYMLLKINNLLKGNKKMLLIGTDGAGKAIYFTINKYTNHQVYVTNRTLSKAKKITKNFYLLENVSHILNSFDIVINCTNVGVKD